MQTIFPNNSAIIVAENEDELKEVFDNITARNGKYIKDIGYITCGNFPQYIIFERSNIIIVRYTGVNDFESEEIVASFYEANGFNW